MLRSIVLATVVATIGAIVVAMGGLAVATPAKAAEGPWCALLNFGVDLSEDCQYRTLEDCRQTIIAGFRGFCNPNPRWQPVNAAPHRRRKG